MCRGRAVGIHFKREKGMGRRPAYSSAFMLFYIVFLTTAIVAPWCPLAVATNPPIPSWKNSGCDHQFDLCANVTTKESWANGGGEIYFSVHALTGTNDFDGANTTVWYIGENYEYSWATDLKNDHFNVVRFSPRGSEFAYPMITCKEAYYTSDTHCWPNASCAEEIARSGLDMRHYSIEETAKDLEWVLRTLGGGNMQNVLIAEGVGTFVVQRMLTLFPRLDRVSVIMAGFTHPEHFDMFGSIGGYDAALQRILTYCEEDKELQCSFRVGALEGMWERFVNVMDAAKLGTLKCNSLLQWGVDPGDMHREYRAIVAALLKYPQHLLLPSNPIAAQLIPSFIYRLQRCSENDLVSLTRLHTVVKSQLKTACPKFIPQRYNWLVNELTLMTPPVTPKELIPEMLKVRQVTPNVTVLQAFYDFYVAFPKYNVKERSIAKTETAILLLYSNVDPVFQFGTATLVGATYAAAPRVLPHQSGFPVSNSASFCIKKNLEMFRTKHLWAYTTDCNLQTTDQTDFVYVDAIDFYGVHDAWEFTEPNPPEVLSNDSPTFTTEEPIDPNGTSNCSNKSVNTLAVFLAIALVACGVLLYMYWKATRVPRLSDDFYECLHH